MADIKISALPGASTLDGTESIPVVQGGVTKKVTTDQFLTKDASGNVGLGVTPSAWNSAFDVVQIGAGSALANPYSITQTWLSSNAFYDTGWKYMHSAESSYYQQSLGSHSWYTAPSGTAGNAISFTQAMTLDTSGNLLVGTTSNPYVNKAVINGSLSVLGPQLNVEAGTSGVTPFEFVNRVGGGFDFYVNNAGTIGARLDASGNLIQTVNTTAATLDTNGTLTFSVVNDTTLRISVRGSDGTTRTATVALA